MAKKTKEQTVEYLEYAMSRLGELTNIVAETLDYVYSSRDERAEQVKKNKEHDKQEKLKKENENG
jgi:hypothetical protein